MPKHVSCCVPLCTNNFRNSFGLTVYRIPKDESIRREYVRLLRNDNLKIESDSTRVCSAHWTGGTKLSRTHLPSIFPWSKREKERRILSRTESTTNTASKKRKVDFGSSTEIDEGTLNEIDHEESIPASFCDAATQTEMTVEMLDRMEKERLARERDELSKELKETSACNEKSEI